MTPRSHRVIENDPNLYPKALSLDRSKEEEIDIQIKVLFVDFKPE